ncbi:hypothetical protein PG989_016456 [Apiospora arundinis]
MVPFLSLEPRLTGRAKERISRIVKLLTVIWAASSIRTIFLAWNWSLPLDAAGYVHLAGICQAMAICLGIVLCAGLPLRKDMMMPTSAWYNWLAASDLRLFSPICETEGSKLARGHYGALEYANQRERLKVAGPRCNVESNDSLMASTGLSPAQGYTSVAGNAADEEHENQHLESVDDGTSTNRGLVDIFDIGVEASRDSSQSKDVESFELDSCRTRRPSITIRPIDISDFHSKCDAGD